MRVAFVTNQLGLRGTEVALAAYADGARERWGWQVFFVVRHARGRPTTADCTPASVAHYESKFDVVYSGCDAATDAWLEAHVDVAVVEMYGTPLCWLPTRVPSIAHCVFLACHHLACTVHTAISETVANGAPGVHVLPYIVDVPLPDLRLGDLRASLGIAPDAVVFGRHGGFDTFDIPWVQDVVAEFAVAGVVFLFMNTRRFCSSPHVVHMDASSCPAHKARFVATCDAMLHARHIGETFGLAVAEFAVQRKPVITHAVARDTEHLRLLGGEALTYRDAHGLRRTLEHFVEARTAAAAAGRTWPGAGRTGYDDYQPDAVMPRFKTLVNMALHDVALNASKGSGVTGQSAVTSGARANLSSPRPATL